MALIRTIGVLAVLLPLLACSQKPHEHVSAPDGKWISLFNGKDLDGWTAKIAGHELNDNFRNTFRVEDGLLKVSYQQYDEFGGRFGSLFYKTEFSHYWIRAEYRFVGDKVAGAPSWTYKNSGIQLHSQSPASMRKDQEFPVCVEFDLIGGRFFGPRPTGDVCQTGTRVKIDGVLLSKQCSQLGDITIRDDQWVTAEAQVQGSAHVKHIVNGNLVVEYSDLELDENNADARRLMATGAGKALTSGYISIQANGHPIEFRRIEVLPLDAGGTQ